MTDNDRRALDASVLAFAENKAARRRCWRMIIVCTVVGSAAGVMWWALWKLWETWFPLS